MSLHSIGLQNFNSGIMMKTYFKVDAKSAQIKNFHLKKDGVSDDRDNIQPRES